MQREDGAALVEFSLVLVLLVLITFGIIGFDRAYNAQVTLTHASREGVRVLAITGDPAAATQAAKDGVSEAVRPSKGVPSGVSVGGIEEVVVATLSGLLAPSLGSFDIR